MFLEKQFFLRILEKSYPSRYGAVHVKQISQPKAYFFVVNCKGGSFSQDNFKYYKRMTPRPNPNLIRRPPPTIKNKREHLCYESLGKTPQEEVLCAPFPLFYQKPCQTYQASIFQFFLHATLYLSTKVLQLPKPPYIRTNLNVAEVCLGPYQASMMECFVENN